MKTINKAQFTDDKGNKYYQTFDELRNEAIKKASEQHYTGTEDEIDEQEDSVKLSYLYDCYLACENVPEIKGECILFLKWLDWLEDGWFI